MRLRGDTEIQGTAAPLGCQVRRLHLRRGECRRFRNVRFWADGSQSVNLVLGPPHRLASGGTVVSDQQPRTRYRSDLDLREALLLRAAVPRTEIRCAPADRQRCAGAATDRSVAIVGRNRCAGGQFAGLRPRPGGPAPAGGSPLEAGHELSAHLLGCTADCGSSYGGQVDGVAAHPISGIGALHLQP
jgi:hypothetical protein